MSDQRRSPRALDRIARLAAQTVFDRPMYESPRAFLGETGARKTAFGDVTAWQTEIAGVRHILIPVVSQRRATMTAEEEDRHYRVLRFLTDRSPPDLVLTYGGRVADFDPGALRNGHSLT